MNEQTNSIIRGIALSLSLLPLILGEIILGPLYGEFPPESIPFLAVSALGTLAYIILSFVKTKG